MYKCNCGKIHELNDLHYSLMKSGREIHLTCRDCDWEIIVGLEEMEKNHFERYSYKVKNEQDTIGKVTSISVGRIE